MKPNEIKGCDPLFLFMLFNSLAETLIEYRKIILMHEIGMKIEGLKPDPLYPLGPEIEEVRLSAQKAALMLRVNSSKNVFTTKFLDTFVYLDNNSVLEKDQSLIRGLELAGDWFYFQLSRCLKDSRGRVDRQNVLKFFKSTDFKQLNMVSKSLTSSLGDEDSIRKREKRWENNCKKAGVSPENFYSQDITNELYLDEESSRFFVRKNTS